MLFYSVPQDQHWDCHCKYIFQDRINPWDQDVWGSENPGLHKTLNFMVNKPTLQIENQFYKFITTLKRFFPVFLIALSKNRSFLSFMGSLCLNPCPASWLT